MVLDVAHVVLVRATHLSCEASPIKSSFCITSQYPRDGQQSPKVLGKYSTLVLCMATSEPLPHRPTHKSRRLRGQEPQQATQEKMVRIDKIC